MNERTERGPSHQAMPSRLGMNECTERSEDHAGMPQVGTA
jgi:hypothetical protein